MRMLGGEAGYLSMTIVAPRHEILRHGVWICVHVHAALTQMLNSEHILVTVVF